MTSVAMLALAVAFGGASPAGSSALEAGRPASQQQEEGQVRGFRADVELVLVDCVVFDDAGNLIVDLESHDLAVYENGERMRIEFFEREGYLEEIPREDIRMPRSPAVWRAYPRNIVIFYDGLNTGATHINRVRPAMRRFIEALAPTDRVMLAMLAPNRRLFHPVDFPGDRDALLAWVERLPGNPRADDEVTDNQDQIMDELFGPSTGGTNLLVASTNVREELAKIKQALTLARAFSQEEAERSRFTMDAILSFGNWLVRQELPRGPLFIVLVSGGLVTRPGISYFAIINQHADDVNEIIMSGNVDGVSEVAFREEANIDMTGDLRTLNEALAHLNATLYTLDARGVAMRPNEGAGSENQSNLPPGQRLLAFQDRQSSLRRIADESGGLAFTNSNDFDRAFDHFLRDASFRYVLGYRPPEVAREPGTFVPIRVEVLRPRMSVRARRGYVVPAETAR